MLIKHFLLALFAFACLLCLFALDGCAQTACPPATVCLTKDEMKFYLGRDDKAKALEAQVVVMTKAIDGDPTSTNDDIKAGYKGVITNLKVELGKTTGTLTGAQQSMVDARVVIQVLSANCKARSRIGLINF